MQVPDPHSDAADIQDYEPESLKLSVSSVEFIDSSLESEDAPVAPKVKAPRATKSKTGEMTITRKYLACESFDTLTYIYRCTLLCTLHQCFWYREAASLPD